jgi:hypothetical protein
MFTVVQATCPLEVMKIGGGDSRIRGGVFAPGHWTGGRCNVRVAARVLEHRQCGRSDLFVLGGRDAADANGADDLAVSNHGQSALDGHDSFD